MVNPHINNLEMAFHPNTLLCSLLELVCCHIIPLHLRQTGLILKLHSLCHQLGRHLIGSHCHVKTQKSSNKDLEECEDRVCSNYSQTIRHKDGHPLLFPSQHHRSTFVRNKQFIRQVWLDRLRPIMGNNILNRTSEDPRHLLPTHLIVEVLVSLFYLDRKVANHTVSVRDRLLHLLWFKG